MKKKPTWKKIARVLNTAFVVSGIIKNITGSIADMSYFVSTYRDITRKDAIDKCTKQSWQRITFNSAQAAGNTIGY